MAVHRVAYLEPFAMQNLSEGAATLNAPPVDARIEPKLHAVPVYTQNRFQLPISGQGTIAVRVKNATELMLEISTVDNGPSLYVSVTEDTIGFSYGIPGQIAIKLDDVLAPQKPKDGEIVTATAGFVRKFLRPKAECTYWLSIDKKNGVLKYGKDYITAIRTLAEVHLMHVDSVKGYPVWDKAEYKAFEKWKVVNVKMSTSLVDKEPVLKTVYPLPVVKDLPPFVVDQQKVTLRDLATGSVTVPANLPVECQQLYGNVAGPNISLDDPDEPDFPFGEAIRRSVNTPGLLGHKKLSAKADEFGKPDPLQTYLRITMGLDMGDSPGCPYVMEIWPAGHYSPIHDHGSCFAIIKVLYGSITATYYDSLDLPVYQTGPGAHLKSGEITWISDKNYQVHKLHNENPVGGQVCVTIQCYQYGSKDKSHYEYFRYLKDVDGDGKPDVVDDFFPNSDWDYIDFRKAIKAEWDGRDKSLDPNPVTKGVRTNGDHA